jgi:hypothetical protein
MKIRKIRLMTLISSLVMVLILGVVTSVFAQDQTPEPTTSDMGMGTPNAVALKATTEDGVPQGVDKATWQKAFGVASMVMGNGGTDAITVMLTGLVPDGQYTLWWVNMQPSMSMGPAGGTPSNEFKAGKDGKATITFTVASDNDYQTLFVAYHADGKTHGEDPGKMGSETFSHLMGAFPGPHGMVPSMGSDQSQMVGVDTALLATTEDGVPQGVDKTTWQNSFGIVPMMMGNGGTDVITAMLTGLVPDGVYTLWWVNMTPSMSMGPAGGVPANEFKADNNGNATVTFTVPSDNDYQTLFVVYHADGKTHGEDPGKMGSESFSHLMGAFPGPANMAMDQSADSMQSTEEPSSP